MATLENIRKRGPLVAIVIGLALLAFILGDGVRSSSFIFSRSQQEIANISGNSVNIKDFQEKFGEYADIYKQRTGGALDENGNEQLRGQVWEDLIRQYVLEEEYKKIGIGVSSDEAFDMVQGNNIAPEIQQLFRNPQTGELNRNEIVQNLKSIEAMPKDNPYKKFWMFTESQMIQKRKYIKYMNLVSKGLYVTDAEVATDNKDKNAKVDINYVFQRYTDVADNLVKVEDADLKAYYKEHKNEYELKEESRDIEYISFDILPSKEDKEKSEKWITEIKANFQAAKDNEQFIKINAPDDVYSNKHLKESEIPANLKTFVDEAKAGDVFGPYLDNNALKITKLVHTKMIPDSVKARHILIRPKDASEEAKKAARAKIDSIKNLIKGGQDFAQLAQTLSDDGSKSQGGDLGWFEEGKMVPAFNDTCFNSKKGELRIVDSQFGIHLVEILDITAPIKKVLLANITRPLEASSETKNVIYGEARQFASTNNTIEKFENAIKMNKLNKRIASNITPNDRNIAGLENPRELIRQAYKTSKNEIIKDDKKNSIYELGNKFVIAKVSEIREKGFASLEQVKDYIRPEVLKQKKAKVLIDKFEKALAGASSLEAVAPKLNTQVQEAKEISFSAFQIPGAGFEPEVIGIATASPVNKISKPIQGKNGVYAVVVKNAVSATAVKSVNEDRQTIMRTNRSKAIYLSFEALRKQANIVDGRIKFF